MKVQHLSWYRNSRPNEIYGDKKANRMTEFMFFEGLSVRVVWFNSHMGSMMVGRSCLAFHAPMIHIICPSEPLVTSGKSLGTELGRERGKISPCLEDFARGNIRQAKDRSCSSPTRLPSNLAISQLGVSMRMVPKSIKPVTVSSENKTWSCQTSPMTVCVGTGIWLASSKR